MSCLYESVFIRNDNRKEIIAQKNTMNNNIIDKNIGLNKNLTIKLASELHIFSNGEAELAR